MSGWYWMLENDICNRWYIYDYYNLRGLGDPVL